MPFLVRKINKRDIFTQLNDCECIEDIYADVPSNEFRTTKGSLSTWIIDELEHLEDAVLAIAVSSSKISKMDFIIIDTEILESNNLEYKKTYAGMDIAIPDLQENHYDIIDISLKKMQNCTNVYRMIYKAEQEDTEKYIVRFTELEIKELLIKAIKDKRVDRSKANKGIKEIMDRVLAA